MKALEKVLVYGINFVCISLIATFTKNALRIRTMWLRDQSSYRTKVMNRINPKETVKFNNHARIFLDKKEWDEIQKLISGTKRQKFNSKFTVIFAKKIQSLGINCWVKNRYNWLYRGKNVFWRGVYYCFLCEIVYECCILPIKDIEKVEIFVKWQDKCQHDKLMPNYKKRLTGRERLETAQQIVSNGGINFEANNFVCKNTNLDKGTTKIHLHVKIS